MQLALAQLGTFAWAIANAPHTDAPPISDDESRPHRPHIVIILGDDVGWANAGWHNPNTLTPRMDALVSGHAVELDRHYVFFYCSPSRASMLSGRLPLHVTENNKYACSPEGALPLRMKHTLASRLRDVGYATHHVGKWHLGQHHASSLPVGRGFDHSLGYLGGGEDHYTNENGGCGNCGKKIDLWRDHAPARGEADGKYSAYRYAAEARSIIDAHAGRERASGGRTPLFLYLALQCAHSPNSPDSYGALYAGHRYTPDFADYNGMVSALDDAVGNVTDALRAAGMWSSALVLFASDNGGPTAESVSGSSANNYPLRGGKHTAWEGGVRGLAWLSGGALPPPARGSIRRGYVHIVDWYATFLGLAGAEINGEMNAEIGDVADAPGMPPVDSIDMWTYLAGHVSTSPRHEVPIASRYADLAREADEQDEPPRGSAALIVGRYKLVRFEQQYCFWTGPLYPNHTTTHAAEEPCDCGAHGCLYDIIADPSETADLAARLPEVAARLRSRAEELDATAIDAVMPEGWRGHNNGTAYCEAADARWGGWWGPDMDGDGAFGSASGAPAPTRLALSTQTAVGPARHTRLLSSRQSSP